MRDIPTGTLEEGMGAAFFPGCLLIVLACLSISLILSGFSGRNQVEQSAKGADKKETAYPFVGAHLKLPGILTLIVGIYLSLLETFGFLGLTPIFIFVLMKTLQARIKKAALTGLLLTGVIYLIFGIGLQIRFPAGSLWRNFF